MVFPFLDDNDCKYLYFCLTFNDILMMGAVNTPYGTVREIYTLNARRTGYHENTD
jgi:hypothetical protein